MRSSIWDHQRKLEPEQRLLLALLCPGFEHAPHATGLHERRLVALATEHGLRIALHQWAAAHPRALSSAVVASLRLHAERTAMRNLMMAAELGRLVGLLRTEGVDAVAFKGPVLAQQLYGDVAAREFSDLDLWVARQQALSAARALSAEGYKPLVALRDSAETMLLEHGTERTFARGSVRVDLHWQLSDAGFALERFTDQRVSVALGGQSVPGFAPEMLLLLLCEHGAKHGWERLAWVRDLAHLLRLPLQWERALGMAEALGLQRAVLAGVELGRVLASAPVPASVQERIQADRTVARLARWASTQVLAPRSALRRSVHRNRYYLVAMERTHARLAHGWRKLFRPTALEYTWIVIPQRFAFLYGWLRPVRLVASWARVARPVAPNGSRAAASTASGSC